MPNANAKKSEQLGMPFGTACNRLRKLVLFRLLIDAERNVCFRCDELIVDVEDLSLEHKENWLDRDPALFWDLDNIAFAHLRCNRPERQRGGHQRVDAPEGSSVCSVCRETKPLSEFSRRSDRWNGARHTCRDCRSRIRSPGARQ